MTELFIEGNRVDLSSDISALLTFAIDDVKDFGARNTTFSKTIVLPGTSNNNKLFGHIFDVTQANPYNPALPNVATNFNAAKSANAIMFQDNMQVFKGVLRLLEVISDRGVIEYEVAVFGELGGFITALGNKKLEELDFTTTIVNYNLDYTLANITGSWDSIGAGDGIYYPLMDYGNYSVNKHDWDYKAFRPALYVFDYLTKILTQSGYRYDAPLFESSRFKSLIVPHNQKAFTQVSNLLGDFAEYTGGSQAVVSPYKVKFGTVSGGFTANGTGDQFTYTGAVRTGFRVQFNTIGTANNIHYKVSLVWYDSSGVAINNNVIDEQWVYGTAPVSISYDEEYTWAINTGEKVAVVVTTEGLGLSPSLTLSNPTMQLLALTPIPVPVTLGQTFRIEDIIPKGVLQRDFFSSILKLFNLYVYEDKFESRKLVITPYVDFYDSDPANFLDWTYKLNRDKPVRLKPMSELNSRYYEFKFKDDSDYYNDQYKKRYNESYGSRIFDTEFEFAQEKATVEVIFAGTPLVGYDGEDKVYSTILKRTGTSTIVEENVDSVIRILQAKKVTGVNSWNIKDGSTVLGSYTSYGYAGHLDDPDAPANDIQFGVPKELFFTLASGAINVNQFNVYYSDYMAEITDPKSLLLTASFYLNPKDIYNLDFSKLIYIDGALFRLNKIEDYNASYPDECKATLLKVIYAGIDGVSGSSFPLSFPVTLGG